MTTRRISHNILFYCCLMFTFGCETMDKPMFVEKQTKTTELLKSAYTEELGSSIYYKSCSDKAFKDGYPDAGNLFNELSMADKVHAVIIKDDLRREGVDIDEIAGNFAIKTTIENLKAALDKERTANSFYQDAIKTADEENSSSAKTAFLWIHDTEKKHIDYLKNIIDAQEKDKTATNNADTVE